MAHRNFFPPNLPDMDRDQFRNSLNPDPRLPMENGTFAFPSDNLRTLAINPVSYSGVPMTPNNYPSSSSGIPRYHPLTCATVDPHQQALPSSSSSSFGPSSPGPCYNHCIVANQKSPSLATPNDRYYPMNFPLDHPPPKPFPGSHSWRWDPAHIPSSTHDYGGSSHAHGPPLEPRWCHNVSPQGPPGTWYGQGFPCPNSGDEALQSSWQRPGPSHVRPTPCYSGPSNDARHAFVRHPRSLSISGGRSVRSRFPCGRFQPYPFDESYRSRWAPLEVDLDSVATFDQHRDLRLDVDNMSYEDLLALGERIGSVSTGLTEETISKCLKRTLYSDQVLDLQIGSCVICLESYEETEEVGILRCGHDFHAGCVSKWLLMKNACPICKLPALDEGE